jgi:hypothetical protein
VADDENKPVAAVLGATGAVGRFFVAAVAATGLARLRLGVRDPAAAAARDLAGMGHDVRGVELWDRGSLDGLIEGSTVVVNCLGPAYRTRSRIASAALSRHVAYLDPNGDDATHARIGASASRSPARAAMVTGAGSVPGVFGLLARWLAAGMPGPVQSVNGYVVTIEPIHVGTATEFLLGLLDRPSSAAVWRGRRRAEAPDGRRTGVRLPHVTCALDAHPYLTQETETVAADLGLRDAEFFHAFESGGAPLEFLESIPDRVRSGGTVRELADELTAKVNADMAGRAPLHMLAFEARSGEHERSVVLRARSSYQLTAGLAMLAAREIIARRIRPGLYRADILPPALVAELPGLDHVTRLDLRDCGLDAWAKDC